MKTLKFALLFALGAITIGFYSCSKDEESDGKTITKIVATNVQGETQDIATVKAWAKWVTEDVSDWDVIAESPFVNNGFSLKLPTTLEEKFLLEFDLDFVEVSNENAKYCYVDEVESYDDGENFRGYFDLMHKIETDYYYISWIYSTDNVTVKGKKEEEYVDYKDIVIFDVTLKRGWNVVYESYIKESGQDLYIYKEIWSTVKPKGINYQWEYYPITKSSIKKAGSLFSQKFNRQ